ncbi:unnamed protein product, partial [Ixodes hexagonus]
ASLWQLHIILWKNVYVKRLRRHYITTILEVALVVALLLGIQEHAVTRERMKVRPDTHFLPSEPAKYWNSMPDVVAIEKVLYHPKTQYLAKLVRETFNDLEVFDVTAVDSLRDLNDAVNKFNDTPITVIGLHFRGVNPNTTDVPRSLSCRVVAGRLPLDTHVDFGEKLLSQPPGPSNEARFVEMNTILPIIGTLHQKHLEYLAPRYNMSVAAVPPVTLQRFPYPSHLEEMDISNYALVMSRFCIGMLVPFAVFAARLTDERSSGMKEMLRIMGLNDWVYWISHYVSAFFMHLITVTLMLLFLCIKHNDKGRSFIQSSDPFLVFWILMMFCSSCLLHAALLSLFFANPASAVAGAMMYWTLCCAMPFLILDHGTGHGYHYIARQHKLWTCIFPGMNLHWSFRVINRFEKFVDTGATWRNFYDHAATPDNVTVAEIVAVGLVFDCVIALLVWYLDNVLPIGPGIPKPLHFPFTASYWIPRLEYVTTPKNTADERGNFEPEPGDQVCALEVVHAYKVEIGREKGRGRKEYITKCLFYCMRNIKLTFLNYFTRIRAQALLSLWPIFMAGVGVRGRAAGIGGDEENERGRGRQRGREIRQRSVCPIYCRPHDKVRVLTPPQKFQRLARKCDQFKTFRRTVTTSSWPGPRCSQVNKTPDCNLFATEFLLRKYAPRTRLQSDSDNEAVFVLGQIVATKHIITMFKELEQKKEDLGIESLGLTVTTLEDVLMRGFLQYDTQSSFVVNHLEPMLSRQNFVQLQLPASVDIMQYLLGMARHTLREYVFDEHAGFQITKQTRCMAFALLQVKHLHLMGGVSSVLYWSTNYFFDFTFYIGTALFVLPPMLLQMKSFTNTDLQSIILLNLLHGFAALPSIYIMSFAFENPIFGYSMIAISAFVFCEHYRI